MFPFGKKSTQPTAEHDERCYAPHCDSSVLHAPEDGCVYCNDYPDWQELRVRWRVNFSGHNDPDKAPCPSTYFRSEETVNRWQGNVVIDEAKRKETEAYWEEFRKQLEEMAVRHDSEGDKLP